MIDVGRLHRLVAEPKGDDSAVGAVLQELHRRRMPERVGCDPFVLQGGACLPCRDQMFGKQIRQPIMAQRGAVGIGEQGIDRLTLPFLHPGPQGGDGIRAQRRAPLLASFPAASHVGAGTEGDILAAQ